MMDAHSVARPTTRRFAPRPLEVLAALRRPGGAPESLSSREHLDAALDWIRHAAAMAGNGGISKGYSLLRGIWEPAYPETTGYTIPTLLNAATALGRADLRQLAMSLADALLEATTPEGGVAHWGGASRQAVVFDTGQVMFGWLSAFSMGQDGRYLEAAIRAGDWLVSIQDPSGAWQAHQYLGLEKVIDTRVAWALLELYQHTGKHAHREAAVRNLAWAQRHQNTAGWFAKCTLEPGADPLTHTLCYTAEGLLESGLLLEDRAFVDAAMLTADALLLQQGEDGSVPATFDAAWRPTSRSSCLTGDCQAALLWLRLHLHTGERRYYGAAEKAVVFVAGTQRLRTRWRNARGAIAGSSPIYGRYERLKYPNWAVKFYIDALLLLDAVKARASEGTGHPQRDVHPGGAAGRLLPYAG